MKKNLTINMSMTNGSANGVEIYSLKLRFMALIEIENIEFHANHGHYREEQLIGNTFLVNL